MPKAKPFTALGKGNGFPHCPIKENVSPYDYWTTLSGYNKNSTNDPDENDIKNSLILAMKLYWNLSGMSASCSAINTQIGGGIDQSGGSPSFDTSDEPQTRVCSFIIDATDGERFARNNIGTGDGTVVEDVSIKRMYNGSTADESNFVGYGAFGDQGGFASSNGGVTAEADSSVELLGYADDKSNPLDFYEEDIDYVTISGMHFVGRAITELDTDNFTTTSDASRSASELRASASQTRSRQSSTYNYSGNSSITGLNFWTY